MQNCYGPPKYFFFIYSYIFQKILFLSFHFELKYNMSFLDRFIPIHPIIHHSFMFDALFAQNTMHTDKRRGFSEEMTERLGPQTITFQRLRWANIQQKHFPA